MKLKTATMISAAALVSGAAFAEAYSIEFTNSDDLTNKYVLTDEGTILTPAGREFEVRFSEDRMEMCTIVPEFADICTQFDSPMKNIGDGANYQTPLLETYGTAKVVAVGQSGSQE